MASNTPSARLFPLSVRLRVVLLALTLCLGLWLWQLPGYWGATGFAFALSLWQLGRLEQSISQERQRFQQFLVALKQGSSNDFIVQSYAPPDDMLEAYQQVSHALNAQKTDQATQLRYYQTLVESSPVPLFSLAEDNHIRLHNHAARHLLPNLTRCQELKQFGLPFATNITALQPGERQLLLFNDGTEQRQLMAQMTCLTTGQGSEKLFSLLDIQRELETAQLQAWQDLVRVLTHEMMNSITPIASLAKTAHNLAQHMQATVPTPDEDLRDLQDATATVARRADGLMQFVQRYRSLTLLPEPKIQTFSVLDLFQRCLSIFQPMHTSQHITCAIECQPKNLTLAADPHLLEQVIINLLRNAQQALEQSEVKPGAIRMQASINNKHELTLSLSDNGPGLESTKLSDIFLPFYTTKPQGAGIGLALARQIMTVHGGSITASNTAEGGAKFTLTFYGQKSI
ncbi:sensor histidine kinase [Simiduia litorea]